MSRLLRWGTCFYGPGSTMYTMEVAQGENGVTYSYENHPGTVFLTGYIDGECVLSTSAYSSPTLLQAAAQRHADNWRREND